MDECNDTQNVKVTKNLKPRMMINLLFSKATTTVAKVEVCGWDDDDKRLKKPDALNNQLTSITQAHTLTAAMYVRYRSNIQCR